MIMRGMSGLAHMKALLRGRLLVHADGLRLRRRTGAKQSIDRARQTIAAELFLVRKLLPVRGQRSLGEFNQRQIEQRLQRRLVEPQAPLFDTGASPWRVGEAEWFLAAVRQRDRSGGRIRQDRALEVQ